MYGRVRLFESVWSKINLLLSLCIVYYYVRGPYYQSCTKPNMPLPLCASCCHRKMSDYEDDMDDALDHEFGDGGHDENSDDDADGPVDALEGDSDDDDEDENDQDDDDQQEVELG